MFYTVVAKSHAALRAHHSFADVVLGYDPPTFEQSNCAHERTWVEPLRVNVLFFPRILIERTASGVYRKRRLDLEDFRPFRNMDLIDGGTPS